MIFKGTTRLITTMASVIPVVTKLSPQVTRVLGCNPGSMTLQGTNTYIIGTGRQRILIDTGDAGVPEYINHLRNVLQDGNIDLAHIFISHWHHDHIGGLADILEELKEFTENCLVWKYPRIEEANTDMNIRALRDGEEFSVEGATVKVWHTPGHTTDHVIFQLREENAVFSADCILGEGTAVFEDLHDYMKSLQLILDKKPDVIYPGHGNVIYDPIERIEYYVAHRVQREQQILEALSHSSGQLFSEEDLVRLIYKGLSEKLAKAAAYNVSHHLEKLLKEKKVQKISEKWIYK
ncbi:endoribonuclease LACTB2 [Euwallacea fornicatus]|uniref:endoribonuclease LACTB2 n=1 Tax=Euwallacea fornicatus TaxID=995702 RepID=UPI0033900228